MKKIIAALLACLLAVSCFASALALDIDYAALTDAELDELIREATAERSSRQTVHVPVAVKAKESRQADTFEVCIERPLDNRRIGQGRKDVSGNTLTTSQINKLRRSCIYTVSKKQNFKIRGFTIAVNARLADVGAAVCFKVYR